MKWIILPLIFLGSFISGYSQNVQYPEWKIYLQEYDIKDITDAGDYFWLAVGNGAIKFEKTTGNVVYYGFEIPEDYYVRTNDSSSIQWYRDHLIMRIKCDNNGLPWVSGNFPGIYRMTEDEEWILIPPVNTDPLNEKIHEILFAEDGVVWTSSIEVLTRYDGEKIDTFSTNGSITSLAEDNMGNLWLGTANYFKGHYEGLVKFDGENWTIFDSSPTGLRPMAFNNIIIEENGTIWMSGFLGIDYPYSYLIEFDGINWKVHKPQPYYIPHPNIWEFAIDETGVKWLGTDQGLIKFDGSNWITYNDSNSGLPANDVYNILIDDNNTKWLRTQKGLVSFKENGLNTPAIQEPILVSEFELFPNPTHDFITLKMPLELTNSRIDILNIEGRTVKTFCVNKNNNRLEVRELPKGIYLIRIQKGNRTKIKKFIKQ